MKPKETVLVTGGTGFVGLQIVFQLLQKGYKVNTTLRSLKSIDNVIESLKSNGITTFENLSFFETNLTDDKNWDKAMQGCKYVLSVASPVFFEVPKDENEAIRPAVEGILRVLKFAKKEGVKRVVMTSNFGAVGFSQTDKTRATTEADWTDTKLSGLSVYEKSKTLAEKAAWNFIKNEGSNLEFATINPVAILGPSLNAHVSESFNFLKHMLDGSMKAVPPITLNIVDVRDVAALHILAMETPDANRKRFIATADGQISMPEIAIFLRKTFPDISSKVSTKTLPVFLVKFGSLFNAQAKQGVMLIKVNRNVSNAQAKDILDWTPIATNEEAIMASVESLVKYDIITSN
ncbi:aldehyde reductase [Flavobacterium jejuense]|uniref:Aldehyde reductase n=1 Tax=Flavobacterium jejuense TaxID=1544455 RepID=A0ABX0IUC4_9FLAO|nr:aldehyde reductase [Flavobacterium jejuense]NHN27308.1 aldehyde reductase [Flavobacterium jejuense]